MFSFGLCKYPVWSNWIIWKLKQVILGPHPWHFYLNILLFSMAKKSIPQYNNMNAEFRASGLEGRAIRSFLKTFSPAEKSNRVGGIQLSPEIIPSMYYLSKDI